MKGNKRSCNTTMFTTPPDAYACGYVNSPPPMIDCTNKHILVNTEVLPATICDGLRPSKSATDRDTASRSQDSAELLRSQATFPRDACSEAKRGSPAMVIPM